MPDAEQKKVAQEDITHAAQVSSLKEAVAAQSALSGAPAVIEDAPAGVACLDPGLVEAMVAVDQRAPRLRTIRIAPMAAHVLEHPTRHAYLRGG